MVTPKPTLKQKSVQHGKTYGEGGDTPMLGKGDRTRVDIPDSAGPQTAATTASRAKTNPKFAEGGQKRQAAEEGEGTVQRVRVAGGAAYPAMAGACGTGTQTIPTGEKVWHGGKKT